MIEAFLFTEGAAAAAEDEEGEPVFCTDVVGGVAPAPASDWAAADAGAGVAAASTFSFFFKNGILSLTLSQPASGRKRTAKSKANFRVIRNISMVEAA